MRNIALDNAKGGLIFLVVLGHFLESSFGWGPSGVAPFLTGIYLFHMPAFIFLAGMTAKTTGTGPRILRLAVLLLAFQTLYCLPSLIAGDGFRGSILQPYWILWFLLSMIWWTLLLPVLIRMPHPLLISLALSAVVGFIPGDGYALSFWRTFSFLPFFVAGHIYGARLMGALGKLSPLRGLAVLTVPIVGFAVYTARFDPHWFTGALSYDELTTNWEVGPLIRIALLAAAAICVVAFLACMTRAQCILTVLGKHSLAIYLLHGFAVKALGSHFISVGSSSSVWLFVITATASVVVTLSLALPIFMKLIDYIPSLVVRSSPVSSPSG